MIATSLNEMSLSEQIRACRAGCVDNPYQGTDKKVLFVCSMGILRSATAARLYAHKYNTRCAGTWTEEALVPITPLLVAWADEIVFVNKNNYWDALKLFGENFHKNIRVLNIPDCFNHMSPELKKEFHDQYEAL